MNEHPPAVPPENAITGEVEVLPPESSADKLYSPVDQAILKENQALRRLISNVLTSDGTTVPENKEDRQLLMEALRGLDHDIHTRAKIKVAAKIEDAISDMADVVGHALANYRVAVDAAPITSTEDLVAVPSSVPSPTFVPGHLDQGSIPIKMSDIFGQDDPTKP